MVSQLVSMVEDYITSSRKKYAPQTVHVSVRFGGCRRYDELIHVFF
jgi:hypothetical protein